jgi:hypothetical protein
VDPGFQVRGAQLKKLRRAEGGAKIVGVFRVKNHDFTPKNHIFPILGGAREIVGVFHVKNHDFTPKNHIFSTRRAPPPPKSAPGIWCVLRSDERLFPIRQQMVIRRHWKHC